jgi:hypothetical protein
MGTTIAVVTGAIVVLMAVVVGSAATDVTLWINAPPGTDEVAVEVSGLALVVEAGGFFEVVVAATATLEESVDPEDPDTNDSLVVRSSMVVDEQVLGPLAQPMRRLATSDA